MWNEIEREFASDICQLHDTLNLDPGSREVYYSLLIYSRHSSNTILDSCFMLKWGVLDRNKLNDTAKMNYAVVFSMLHRENPQAIEFLFEKFSNREGGLSEFIEFINSIPPITKVVKNILKAKIKSNETPVIKNQYIRHYISLISSSSLKSDIKYLKPYLSRNEILDIKNKIEIIKIY